ncbi:MAG: alpha/beta hydrolase [Candidatus Limnocylindrales bacterium]
MRVSLPQVALPRAGRVKATAVPAALAGVPRPGVRFEKHAWIPAGVAIAAAVVLGSILSATVQSTDAALVLMGFDPDRAQLITSLIIAAIASAAVTVVVNRIAFATLLGAGSVVALFTQTFVTETQNALGATGALGSFDLIGWVLTLVTLAMIAVIASWAGATIAAAVRPSLIASGVALREIVRTRRPSRQLARRPIAAALVLVLLVVTVPAFGDMVNLSPDALMLAGSQYQGLAPGNSIPNVSPVTELTASPTPTSTPTTSASSTATTSASAPATPFKAAKPGTKPWLAWKPTGIGHLTMVNLPAPWVGGTKSTSEIDIYTPPGYDNYADRLYPVLYEAPTGIALWDKGTHVLSALDDLIDSGQMPATIVVFIDSLGAPYGDTQCADAMNASQWFEQYISTTVPNWVDSRYKTIKDPRARGIMGMSAGGFCATMLEMRHPDVFGISISFSGYFWAGAAGTSSALPFGNAEGINSHSPAVLAPQIPAKERPRMYFDVIACMGQKFYGPEAQSFEKILKANGFPYLAVSSPYTHGWSQVRYETPGAMADWGARLVINGIW